MYNGEGQDAPGEPEEKEMKYESLGPVLNEDGTPTELTKRMLAGTGRELTPPFDILPGITVLTPEGSFRGTMRSDDSIHIDDWLEAEYEDRNGPGYDPADDPEEDQWTNREGMPEFNGAFDEE